MAVLYADSFARYDSANILAKGGWTQGSNGHNMSIQTSGGPFNDWYMYCNGGANHKFITRGLPVSLTTVIFSLYFKVFTMDQLHGLTLISFLAGSTEVFRIVSDTSGYLKLTNVCTVVAATASAPMSTNVWNHIAGKVVVGNAGSAILRLNNVEIMNASPIDTMQGSDSNINGIRLPQEEPYDGNGIFSGNQAITGYGSLIIMDTTGSYCNDLLGIRRVKPYVPKGDGNYKQWTPSTGTDHYPLVDEVPPNDDSDFNSAASADLIDTFTLDPMAAGLAPDAIVCSLYSKAATPGEGKLKGVVRSNAQDGLGTEVAVPSSYAYGQSVIYVDPNTGQPFTRAAFNAAEFGYKRTV